MIEETFKNIESILNPIIVFDELLGCPFCGAIPEISERELEYGCCSTEYKNIIYCGECDFEFDVEDYIYDEYSRGDSVEVREDKRNRLLTFLNFQKQSLIKKWNTRS